MNTEHTPHDSVLFLWQWDVLQVIKRLRNLPSPLLVVYFRLFNVATPTAELMQFSNKICQDNGTFFGYLTTLFQLVQIVVTVWE
jgi:hypothetical protein